MVRFLVALLLFAVTLSVRAEPAARIQYAEAVSIKASVGSVSFDAYGRRFDMELTRNERILSTVSQQRKAELVRSQILRGNLVGQPQSWVRLTEFDGRVEGAIWDGRDFYAVTSLENITPYLTTPIPGAPTQTVVYRLSDTINAFPKNFCADAQIPAGERTNGLDQYRHMVAELATEAASSATIPLQIEISLIADASFQNQYGSYSTQLLLARHNVADGVYAEQVRLLLLPSDVRMAPTSPDPFTSTDPSTLLGQLSTFRQNNNTVGSLGLAHLVTGRQLDGTTVGIARIGGVCSVKDGVSLSEATSLIALDGLIMAHELGHNFGAVHDGTGVCAATPQTFLMAPQFNWSTMFSQCSLDAILPVIRAAKCVKPADYGDVSLPAAGPTLSAEAETPLTVPFVVSSSGTQTARNAALDVNMPLDVSVSGFSGAACSMSGETLHCTLGDIPSGEARTVNVTVTSSVAHQSTLDAYVSADNNPSTHNDTQHQPIAFVINADARITMVASAATVLVGDPVDFTIRVDSLRSHAAQDVTVTFDGPLLQVASATVTGGSCRVDLPTVCTLDDVPGGSSRTITIHATAAAVGSAQPNVHVNARIDADTANNVARLNLRVNAVRDIGIDEVTPNVISLFGQPFEFDANVHSYGAQSIANVRLSLLIQTPAYATHNDAIESVTVGGVVCAPQLPNGGYYECPLGTMAPGEVRALVIRGHGADLGTYAFQISVSGTGDQYSYNNSLSHGVTVMNAVDVAVTSPSPLTVPEGQEGHGTVFVISNGSQASSNVSFDVSAPASMRFTRLYIPSDKGTCNIVTDQNFHCTLIFPDPLHGTGGTNIDYFLIGSVPGSYNLTATVTAANDEMPANDSKSLPVTIAPLVNVGVRDFTGPQYLGLGREVTIDTTVFTGSRPVPRASAIVGTALAAETSSVTTGTGTCTRIDPTRFQCDFGDLPANASVPLTAVIRGAQTGTSSQFFVNASAPGDNDASDNIRSITFTVSGPGDLSVQATGSVAATAATPFSVAVTIRHTGEMAGGRLSIELPAGVSFNSMSGAALVCSGTSNLDCTLPGWPQNQDLEVDLNLQASTAGSYTVNAKVSSANDTDASNNEASSVIAVSAAPVAPPPPPSGGGSSGGGSSGGGSPGGGGGGGSIDAVLLAVLSLLLVWRRVRRSDLPSTVAMSL
jgi:metallopeptidase family M12-like protein/uncharacterized protein DUF11